MKNSALADMGAAAGALSTGARANGGQPGFCSRNFA
jgi:hypothetical protein